MRIFSIVVLIILNLKKNYDALFAIEYLKICLKDNNIKQIGKKIKFYIRLNITCEKM